MITEVISSDFCTAGFCSLIYNLSIDLADALASCHLVLFLPHYNSSLNSRSLFFFWISGTIFSRNSLAFSNTWLGFSCIFSSYLLISLHLYFVLLLAALSSEAFSCFCSPTWQMTLQGIAVGMFGAVFLVSMQM